MLRTLAQQTRILRAVAGLSEAGDAETVLRTVLSVGSELLLAGSTMLVEGQVVTASQPEALVGARLQGMDAGEQGGAVSATEALAIRVGSEEPTPLGPAVTLQLAGRILVFAGLPEVDERHEALLEPLLDMGRTALMAVDRRLRRQERVAKRLEGSEAMVVALVESTRDPVWVLDESLVLRAFNRAFVELMETGFGLTPKMHTTLESLPEPHRTRHDKLYRRCLRKGPLRIDWTTPDRSRVFDVDLNPIQVGGQNVGVSVYCRDVTEVRRAAALLERAKDEAEQANRAKSAFLAQMSHEIRTPLNAIVGLIELILQEDAPLSTDALLQSVKANSSSLLHLVSGILDFSRIEAGQIEIRAAPMDFEAMVTDVLGMLRPRAEDRGLTLELEVGSGFPDRVRGDESRLRQVVVNLVENALKYTTVGTVCVTVVQDDDEVVLTVEDTGPGIPLEEQGRIFERFHQLARVGVSEVGPTSGVGLGLAITRELVQRMGGSIGVDSRVGEGTTFDVRLPLPVVRPAPGHPTSTGRRRLVRRCRVLVVDDSVDNRAVTAALLERVGHTVVQAASGQEALDEVERSERAGRDVEFVLMDVHMPGLDGLETARRLRESGFTAPIVALTAHATNAVAASCRQVGMDGFLTKPVPAATLEETVLEYGRGVRALVVDDSRESRLILRAWLSRAGVEVVEAGTVEAALDQPGPVDVLLVDHSLPDGTGAMLVDRLRDAGVDAPFVAISGHDATTIAEIWPDASRYVCKPFTEEAVLAAIEAALSG